MTDFLNLLTNIALFVLLWAFVATLIVIIPVLYLMEDSSSFIENGFTMSVSNVTFAVIPYSVCIILFILNLLFVLFFFRKYAVYIEDEVLDTPQIDTRKLTLKLLLVKFYPVLVIVESFFVSLYCVIFK